MYLHGLNNRRVTSRNNNTTARLCKYYVMARTAVCRLWDAIQLDPRTHAGAQRVLGNLLVGWESVDFGWQGTDAIHEEVFIATRLHASWVTHSASCNTRLQYLAPKHRTDYLPHASYLLGLIAKIKCTCHTLPKLGLWATAILMASP